MTAAHDEDPVLSALLAAILDEPDVDLHRLAYADRLEEFAAVQCVPCPRCSPHACESCPECDGRPHSPAGRRGGRLLSLRSPCTTCRGTGKFPAGFHPERDPASGRHEGGWTSCKECNGGGRGATARAGFVFRSDGLAERADFVRWAVRCPESTWARRDGCVEPLWMKQDVWADSLWRIFGGATETEWVWRRGFVESVRCRLDDWLAHGPAVVAAHPVTALTITDKEPLASGKVWSWFRGDDGGGGDWHAPPSLPPHVYDLLPASGGGTEWASTSRDFALDALEAAALEWAPLEAAKVRDRARASPQPGSPSQSE